jgi:hypothetical protein
MGSHCSFEYLKHKLWPKEGPEIKLAVATLALGSRPRQKGLQGCGPKGSLGVTSKTPGVQESVREWAFTLPGQLPLWERESRWTPETSESHLRGQNSMACCALYINGKLLERRCLKWARIAHLDIWNTSYGQKKGRESDCQFDSRPEKVGNRPDLLSCRQRATYRWKALDESYKFASDRVAIWGLLAKLCGFKVAGVLASAVSGVPRGSLGSPGTKRPFRCGPRGKVQSIL